jgi:uncharacterized protein YkwD
MKLSALTGGFLAVALVTLTACTVGTVPGGPAPEAASSAQAPVPSGGFGAMLNAQRAAGGLPAATPDARLTAAAEGHAADMAARDYFSHTSPEGLSSADRVRASGYSTCRPSEVIAFGQQSEAEVLQVWVNSPPHLANLMMRGPVQYGLGHVGNKWVLVIAGVC